MRFITRLITSTLAIIIVAYFLPGVHVDTILTAIVLAVVLAFMNSVVKPILILFTLPITIFTLGLFLLVINAIIILLATKVVHGFHVDGFGWALLFSIILSLVNSILGSLASRTENRDE